MSGNEAPTETDGRQQTQEVDQREARYTTGWFLVPGLALLPVVWLTGPDPWWVRVWGTVASVGMIGFGLYSWRFFNRNAKRS
jgi:hypothetical protein